MTANKGKRKREQEERQKDEGEEKLPEASNLVAKRWI